MNTPADKTGENVLAPGPGPRQFATTRWSLVVAAGHKVTPEAHKALATLCNLYWYPAYAFVRRRGHDADASLDLTQGFFTRLLEKNDLAAVDRRRGKFRSWLLGAMKHFLANQWDKAGARKRGGGRQVLSIDAEDAEGRYRREPSHELTAERIFDRRWALTLLDQVLAELRQECAREGKGHLFEVLKGSLVGDGAKSSYRDVAADLGMTEGAVKVAVHRLKRRYRELLRAEILETVDEPTDVDEEIRDLFAALG